MRLKRDDSAVPISQEKHQHFLEEYVAYKVRREDVAEESRVDAGTDFLEWSPVTIGALCALVATTVLICAVSLFWCRHRRRHQKLLNDLILDDSLDIMTKGVIKSAPTSRTPSPKMSKRMSCPDALAMRTSPAPRSVTATSIPDFTLPPERVQPYYGPPGPNGAGANMTIQQLKRASLGPAVLGAVMPELYHQQSFSEDDEPKVPETANGRLWFSLLYDDAMEQLHVTLIKVKDLPPRPETPQLRDPFIRMYLLPDERTCRTSKSKKKTLNPVYNETHSFPVASDDVHSRVIRFSVYDVDKRRVLHSLGHVMINLKPLELHRGDVMWSDLEPTAHAASSLGELQISLAMYPQNNKIKMGIHRARNLKNVVECHETASYIRAQLHYGHKSHRVKTTRPVRQTSGSTEHNFNEALSFTVHGRQLEQCHLTLTLMIVDPEAPADHQVGRITIGPFMYARGEQLLHWQEMMAAPRNVTTRWHSLSPILNTEHH